MREDQKVMYNNLLQKSLIGKKTYISPTFLLIPKGFHKISQVIISVSICPVHRSPFGWSVAICGLLISHLHLSLTNKQQGISLWNPTDESVMVPGLDCKVDSGAPPLKFGYCLRKSSSNLDCSESLRYTQHLNTQSTQSSLYTPCISWWLSLSLCPLAHKYWTTLCYSSKVD